MIINIFHTVKIFFAIICLATAAPKQNIEVVQCTKELTCLSSSCNQTAVEVSNHIAATVNPCDDFYAFACGGFLRENTIPDDQLEVNEFSLINGLVFDKLHKALEERAGSNEPNAFKLLKKLYRVCMDTSSIEKDGLHTAKLLVSNLGGWPVLEGNAWKEDEFDWKELMYKLRRYGFSINSFLRVRVELDVKNSSRRIVVLDQAELPLNRLNLLSNFYNNIVQCYYDYLVDLAVIFGGDKNNATSEFREIFEFLFDLAMITLPAEDRRNLTAMTNIMTISELAVKFPYMNWIEYINNIMAIPDIQVTSDDLVDVGTPQFVADLDVLLRKTPKRVQSNYIMSVIVSSMTSALSKEVKAREFQLSKEVLGMAAVSPRWKQCLTSVTQKLPVATAALYARKYFNEDAKANVEQLVGNIHDKFVEMLKEVDWMDAETQKEALNKANSITSHIAYPRELLDDKKLDDFYEKLNSSESYLRYILNIQKFNLDNAFKSLREVVYMSSWIEHSVSHEVNAFYHFGENSIILPAGILQGAMFDNTRPNYMNYGSIGFVVGHELTHGFDDKGKQMSKKGELENWWSDNTQNAFANKAQCIINQYSNFSSPKLGLHLNGIITQGENIADNGGAKLAYEAYQIWTKKNGPEKCLPKLQYTPNQLFWISLANTWCTNERDENLKTSMLSKSHPPSMFRVLGIVSNSEYFAKDFNCAPGSAMNPKQKCTFW